MDLSVSMAPLIPKLFRLSINHPWLLKQMIKHKNIISWELSRSLATDIPSLTPTKFASIFLVFKKPHAHMTAYQAQNLFLSLAREGEFLIILTLFQKPVFGFSKTLWGLIQPRKVFDPLFLKLMALPHKGVPFLLASEPLVEQLNPVQAFLLLVKIGRSKLDSGSDLAVEEDDIERLLYKISNQHLEKLFEIWKARLFNGEDLSGLLSIPLVKEKFGREYGQLVYFLLDKNDLFTISSATKLLNDGAIIDHILPRQIDTILELVAQDPSGGKIFYVKVLNPLLVKKASTETLDSLFQSLVVSRSDDLSAVLESPMF